MPHRDSSRSSAHPALAEIGRSRSYEATPVCRELAASGIAFVTRLRRGLSSLLNAKRLHSLAHEQTAEAQIRCIPAIAFATGTGVDHGRQARNAAAEKNCRTSTTNHPALFQYHQATFADDPRVDGSRGTGWGHGFGALVCPGSSVAAEEPWTAINGAVFNGFPTMLTYVRPAAEVPNHSLEFSKTAVRDENPRTA